MKFDIRRIFARSGDPAAAGPLDDAADTDYLPVNGGGEGLETDYQALIASHFRRFGVSNQCTTIEVKKIGTAPDGYDVFIGMVRLVRWEQTSALRLLLGIPMLEAKIRKTVRATWLADYSHFAGLWLHVSEQMQIPPELRDLIGSLAPLPANSAAANLQGDSGVPSSGQSAASMPGPLSDGQEPAHASR